MRKILLAGLCLFVINGAGALFAQNKTLGVGVATPNPNAALHVESPTGNQGFIMPRLTTAQRTAMRALLTSSDNGVMLYDTDLNTIFIWDGATWKSSSQVAGGPSLIYPYKDSISTSPGANETLFKILYAGSVAENVGVAHFENQNPQNTKDAITVTTNGTGSGGRFTVTNKSSKKPVLWIETNSDSALSAPIYGLNTGTGDVAASFKLTNPQNGYPALFAESFGTGRTATFRKMGTTGGQPAVFIDSRGGHGIWADHKAPTGFAGIIQTIDTANTNAALLVETIGTGPSVWALKSPDAVSGDALLAVNEAAADGFAGSFRNTHAGNTYPAIQASTEGAGSGVRVMQTTGIGAGIDIFMQNALTTAPGFSVDNGGLDHAAIFKNTNTGNAKPAVIASTNGTGSVLVLDHANNGMAIEMINGGLKYSVADVSTPGQISVLAGLYKISAATQGSIFSLPANVPEGTFCKVFNAGPFDITLDPVYIFGGLTSTNIAVGAVRDFIFINSTWYEN